MPDGGRMARKRTLQELTIKDNFMFGAVMTDEENCRMLLERVLGFSIGKVEISKEQSFIYHPEHRGIRLDIYAKGDDETCYNVEMQALPETSIAKRTRYYHSQMDMELLLSGDDYASLTDTFVIFICDFDPFGMKKYQYTFLNRCQEDADLTLNDGNISIFLSTHGENEPDVSEALVKFLRFVKAGLQESENDFGDVFVERLQQTIRHVKSSREMEKKYMLIEELIGRERKEAYTEGKIEGRIEDILVLLKECGQIPDSLRNRIVQMTDVSVLNAWLKLAARVDSIDEFIKSM